MGRSLSEKEKYEFYEKLLLLNIYYLDTVLSDVKKARKFLEECKNKIIKIKGNETIENTKELSEIFDKLIEPISDYISEKKYIKKDIETIVKYFQENISSDFYYIPYREIKKYFKIPSICSISYSSEFGIFGAIGSIIIPEVELIEDAVICYFLLEDIEKLELPEESLEKRYNINRINSFYLRHSILACITFMEAILNNMIYDFLHQKGKTNENKGLINNMKKAKKGNFDAKWKVLKEVRPEFGEQEGKKCYKDYIELKKMRNCLVHLGPESIKSVGILDYKTEKQKLFNGINGMLELSKNLMLKIEKKNLELYHNFDFDEYKKVAEEFLKN